MRFSASLASVAIVCLVASCSSTDSPPGPIPQGRPTPTERFVAFDHASARADSAVTRGRRSIEPGGAEGLISADVVAAEARKAVAHVRASRAEVLVEAASRDIHLAIFAGSLPTRWAVPPPKRPKRNGARGKGRIRLKYGEIALIFPKGQRKFRGRLFDEEGRMIPSAYREISRLLGDPGHQLLEGKEAWYPIHPRLLTMMYYTCQHFDRWAEVISAYRVKKRSSKRSNHTKGRAIDFKMRGAPRRQLLAYVEKSFSRIGVGWYPRSTFIHLDTRGRTYYWVDRSRPGQRQRPRKRRIGRKPRPGTDPTAATIHIPPLPKKSAGKVKKR